MGFTETNYENSILELLQQDLGYAISHGPDINRDYKNPLFEEDLTISITRINKDLPKQAINEALDKLRNIDAGTLIQKNQKFTDYLQNGIPVTYYSGTEEQNTIVRLIDYNTPKNNTYRAINQWTVIDYETRRPDIVIFINGIPLVVVELKSPSREETDASEAYLQIRNYIADIPSLFVYNAFCILSDQSESKVGTITADEDRYMEWKTVDGKYENNSLAAFDTLFLGMLEKRRILELLKHYICYSEDKKILAGYHQYFGVKRAIDSVNKASLTDGKGGVFWHTQGSGKSLSMVFFAKSIQDTIENPTLVIITDRNDLDGQLFGQFAKCAPFLRQTPENAESRKDLRDRLLGRKANGIIFTTMQKFEEYDTPLSERRNIIVIADEAHRGQSGLEERIDEKTGRIKIGTARKIRNSLPNATYIGFTGTPIFKADRNTQEIFGNYIDIYDMTQSVDDGATRPIYYESRVVNIKLDPAVLAALDERYGIVAEKVPEYVVDKSKKDLGNLESILGAPETIDSLCQDIITHYEENRASILTGKALIVAYSRSIAIKIYRRILELRPDWTEKICVVMTSDNKDPEDWKEIVGNKNHKKEMEKKLKDNSSPLKIAIVVDMWLAGFDLPSLSTMYVYKYMVEHNLMQAIARVNRVFSCNGESKEGGLIVDYIGIARALKKAMNEYTSRDKNRYGNPDIQKTAYPKFQEKLEVCRSIFHGYDYHEFLSGTDLTRARLISGGVNFLSAPELAEKKKDFVKESLYLKRSYSLCKSIVPYEERMEAAYFDAIRTLITRIEGKGVLSLKEINAQINELLKQSVQSDGVINLFSDIEESYSLFDPKFLAEISKMKEKNLAVELLRKLLNDQLRVYTRTNLTKSRQFSEILTESLNGYLNGMLTNEKVIEELLNLAEEMAKAKEEGQKLGLTAEELAFYDALTTPQGVKDVYTNSELLEMTKELTELLQKNKTIDWQKKEQARAGMRRLVKRLLKKYKYPPEGQEEALNTVIEQCEMWTDNQIMN